MPWPDASCCHGSAFLWPSEIVDHLPVSRLIGGVGRITGMILIGKVFRVLISSQSQRVVIL
jgi:hypothetical protein